VSNKKQRDTAAQDAEILARRQQEAKEARSDAAAAATEEQGATDVLGQEDEDVIF
jgi:V-type H+-transporting ATPase subunit D